MCRYRHVDALLMSMSRLEAKTAREGVCRCTATTSMAQPPAGPRHGHSLPRSGTPGPAAAAIPSALPYACAPGVTPCPCLSDLLLLLAVLNASVRAPAAPPWHASKCDVIPSFPVHGI